MTEPWEITTGDGSVSLYLPPDFSAELDAHTGDGSIRNDLNVRDTERLAQRAASAPSPRRSLGLTPELHSAQTSLQRALGTKVDISRGKHGGRIVISFTTDDELSAILAQISGTDDDLDL